VDHLDPAIFLFLIWLVTELHVAELMRSKLLGKKGLKTVNCHGHFHDQQRLALMRDTKVAISVSAFSLLDGVDGIIPEPDS